MYTCTYVKLTLYIHINILTCLCIYTVIYYIIYRLCYVTLFHYAFPYIDAAAAKSLQSCLTVRPHRWQPTRLPCSWDSPSKNTGVGCHFLLQCLKVKSESEVAQSWPTLCDPTDYSLPGSTIHGIFQARILEWVAISFSKRSSWPRDWTRVSCIIGRRFTVWATREVQSTVPTNMCS